MPFVLTEGVSEMGRCFWLFDFVGVTKNTFKLEVPASYC